MEKQDMEKQDSDLYKICERIIRIAKEEEYSPDPLLAIWAIILDERAKAYINGLETFYGRGMATLKEKDGFVI